MSPRSHIKASFLSGAIRDTHQFFFPRLKRQFVWSFYFFLPPSLSLPSEQSVSVATSHPSPLHPDWQMQCQTFWSRTHLPLLLHSPGQPSVNTSRICQTAKRIRTRKSGWEGEEGVRRQERKGLLEWTEEKEGQKWLKKKKKKDSNKWTYGTIHLQQDWGWGAGEVGSCEALRSFHMSFTIMCNHSVKGNAWDKRTTNHLSCLLTVEKPVGDAANACWVKCSQQWLCV